METKVLTNYTECVIKKERCYKCNKKVGLLGLNCRCEKMFCSQHLHADEHDCTFDYKKRAQDFIQSNNPIVKKAKIIKI